MTMGILEGIFEGEAEESEFLITEVFKASWVGDCSLDPWHKIRRGDLIGRAVRGDNPLVNVRGYVCALCVKSYSRLEE
jgi:hypothetical protein